MSERWPWIAGVVFVVVSFGVASIAPGYDVEPSVSLPADVLEDADTRSAVGFVSMASIPLLLAFAAAMRRRLEGGSGDVFFAGAVLLGAAMLVEEGVAQMATAIGGLPEEAVLARLIIVFDWNVSVLFAPGILAMGAAAVVGGAREDRLPWWLVVGAVVVALSSVMFWIAPPVALVWIAAASISQLVERRELATV